jgi:hypothetical protein
MDSTAHTITISNFVFGQYRSRGLLSEMEDMGLIINKSNKNTTTITIDDEVLNFIIDDLNDQITYCDGIDSSAKRALANALAKFQAAQQSTN